uniref:Protein FAR1-RELATED SEQUENCE n=1 Tax=Lactuca sativa TaxID=4236 RepID=A0A9R1W8N8_LACSA|nr:hypothetical protein LSAT_V11C300110020 [Lactuca sativa]
MSGSKRNVQNLGHIDIPSRIDLTPILSVKCDQKEDTFICSMKFEQFGVLCRHIFTAMKAFDIQFIPAKYLLRRWQKDIIPSELLRRCFRYSDSDENIQKNSN